MRNSFADRMLVAVAVAALIAGALGLAFNREPDRQAYLTERQAYRNEEAAWAYEHEARLSLVGELNTIVRLGVCGDPALERQFAYVRCAGVSVHGG